MSVAWWFGDRCCGSLLNSDVGPQLLLPRAFNALQRAQKRPKEQTQGGGEPPEVDRHCREEGLDTHGLVSATHIAGQLVPGLGFAMKAFRTQAVSVVEALVLIRPALTPAAGAQ